MSARILIVIPLALALAACAESASGAGGDAGPSSDTGRTVPDAGPGADAGDAGADADPLADAGSDAGTMDGGNDSDADTGTMDGGDASDTATDASTDTGSMDSGDVDPGDADSSDTETGDTDAGFCGTDRASAMNATLPVDIVWVIDGSPSMDDTITIIEDNIDTFAERIGDSGLDYRVVLLGADREYCFDARCYSEICMPPPLSASATCPDQDSAVYRHVREGVHSSDSIDLTIANYSAYSDFLRDGSVVHFVFVTDDDAGFGPGSEELLAFLSTEIEPNAEDVYVHSVVDLVDSSPGCGLTDDCSCGEERGDEYIAASDATGGLVYSVCETDWSPIFDALEETVVEGTILPCEYAVPEVDFTIEIDEVNVYFYEDDSTRVVVPNVDGPDACAGDIGWYYDDPVDPANVILCAATCGDVTGAVELEFGCDTIKE